jgi:2-pyrone-4,6-dicarboxylate lactonase
MSPKLKLPPGACDCHFHIFGPQQRFPLPPDRKRQVSDRTLDDVIVLQNAMGISRGLLVQSFQHGNTYEYMLHALSREPNRLRAVAIPAPDITDLELAILTKAGVVGTRFAPRVMPNIDFDLLHRVHELGWHPHVLVHGADEVEAWRDQILSVPGKFVLEHTGYPPVQKGLDSPEFRFVLECLDTGRCWVKLSPRFSAQRTIPFSDTLPFIHALVERAPDRLLWGSDWPHQSHPEPKPADQDLIDLMLDWVPDEAIRNCILVDNPADLFGFPSVHHHS